MNIKKYLDFINNRVYNEYTNRDRKLSKLGKTNLQEYPIKSLQNIRLERAFSYKKL